VCKACRESHKHYRREGKRGNPGTGRRLKPCGTNAAAKRHRKNNEPLDLLCRVAEAAYNNRVKKPVSKKS
jgi:hypothetical protein